MKRSTAALIGVVALSCFTTPAFALFAFGTKGELAKAIEKTMEDTEPCYSWPTSDPDKTLVFSTKSNKLWNEWRNRAEAFEKFGLGEISNTNSEQHYKDLKKGSKFFLMQSRFGEVETHLGVAGLQMKPISVIRLALTEKGKAVFKQTSKPAAKRFGICSGGRFTLDELRRWSEPTPLEGKMVTEVVFTRKPVNMSKLYSELRQEVLSKSSQKSGEWVMTLYKTSDGWLPLGQPTYREVSGK